MTAERKRKTQTDPKIPSLYTILPSRRFYLTESTCTKTCRRNQALKRLKIVVPSKKGLEKNLGRKNIVLLQPKLPILRIAITLGGEGVRRWFKVQKDSGYAS